MDRVAKPLGDDHDLDALMVRVREAALAGASGSGAPRPQLSGETNGADVDLARVLDAQGEWNDQARQSLAALVECLRTLRDNWAEAHARLQEELRQISAAVEELRSGTAAARGAPQKRRTVKPGRRRR
jgi:hypothetical protein